MDLCGGFGCVCACCVGHYTPPLWESPGVSWPSTLRMGLPIHVRCFVDVVRMRLMPSERHCTDPVRCSVDVALVPDGSALHDCGVCITDGLPATLCPMALCRMTAVCASPTVVQAGQPVFAMSYYFDRAVDAGFVEPGAQQVRVALEVWCARFRATSVERGCWVRVPTSRTQPPVRHNALVVNLLTCIEQVERSATTGLVGIFSHD